MENCAAFAITQALTAKDMPRGRTNRKFKYKKRKSRKSSAYRKKSQRNSRGRSKTLQSSTYVPRSRTVIVSDIRRYVVTQGTDTAAPSYYSFPANTPASTFGTNANVLDGVWRDNAFPVLPNTAESSCPGVRVPTRQKGAAVLSTQPSRMFIPCLPRLLSHRSMFVPSEISGPSLVGVVSGLGLSTAAKHSLETQRRRYGHNIVIGREVSAR